MRSIAGVILCALLAQTSGPNDLASPVYCQDVPKQGSDSVLKIPLNVSLACMFGYVTPDSLGELELTAGDGWNSAGRWYDHYDEDDDEARLRVRAGDLVVVSIGSPELLDQSDFDRIARVPQLAVLWLLGTLADDVKISPEAVDALCKIKSIRYLRVEGDNSIATTDLVRMIGALPLEGISLVKRKTGVAEILSAMCATANLHCCELDNLGAFDKDFAAGAPNPDKLRAIQVVRVSVPSARALLDWARKSPVLESVSLGAFRGTPTEVNNAFRGIPVNVERLALVGSGLDGVLPPLAFGERLRRLTVRYCSTTELLRVLGHEDLPSTLREFDFASGRSIGNEVVGAIAKLEALVKLSITWADLEDRASLAPLERLAEVEEFAISQVRYAAKGRFLALPTMPALKHLSVRHCHVQDKDIEKVVLAATRTLLSISLTDCPEPTGKFLAAIDDKNVLKRIDFLRCRALDAALVNVARKRLAKSLNVVDGKES